MWKVMIVDDEQTARLGLERIISETMPELIVTTKAENGMDALEKIEKRQPDIVISDSSKMCIRDSLKTGTICYYDFFICSTYRKSDRLNRFFQ